MPLNAVATSSATAIQGPAADHISTMNSSEPALRARDENAALLATAVAFAICSVTFATLYVLAQNPAKPFTAFDGTPFASYSVVREYRTHEAVVGVTAILCLFTILVPGCTRLFNKLSVTTRTIIFSGLMFVASSCLLAAVWHFPHIPPWNAPMLWAKQYGLHVVITPRQSYIAGIIFASYLLICGTAGTIKKSKFIWSAILLYAGFLVVPGMMLPLRLDGLSSGEIESSFFHYSALFNTKTMLVGGQQPTDLGYGIGWNVFFAIMEKMFGPFSWADDIRFVQSGDIAYAALTVLTLFIWLRDRPWIALAASLLVLPWVQTLHTAIFYPNQTGFRFIFFPIVFSTLGLMRNTSPMKRSWLLGALCGFAALWNFETAIALSGGLIVYLFVRLPVLSSRTIVSTSTLFLAGVLSAAIIFELIVNAAFGFIIPPAIFAGDGLGRVSAIRYFGQLLTPNPIVIASFALSLWFLFYGAAVRSSRLVSAEIAEGMALATVLILWAGYYLVQPDEWNSWSYLLPVSLLAAVAWPVLAPARSSGLSLAIGLTMVVAIGMAIGPLIYRNQILAFASVYASVGRDNPPASTLISGVYVNPTDREQIKARFSGLADIPKNYLVFSGDTYLLAKLTNKSSRFWVIDPAYVLQTDAEFKELIRQVIARRPDEILFDKAEGEAPDNPHRRYFAFMRDSLASDYVTSNDREGWTVLRRRDL
jgi:hypothetical protein